MLDAMGHGTDGLGHLDAVVDLVAALEDLRVDPRSAVPAELAARTVLRVMLGGRSRIVL